MILLLSIFFPILEIISTFELRGTEKKKSSSKTSYTVAVKCLTIYGIDDDEEEEAQPPKNREDNLCYIKTTLLVV